jgi:lipoprotein NlpD
MRYNYLFITFFITLMLGACSSPYQAPVNDVDGGPRYLDSGKTHLVNEGETLYAIAWMYDLDFAALARANNLREPYSVDPGQRLTVDLRGQPVAAAAQAPQVATGSATVTTSPVQTTGAIQRTPLGSSGISRRELPSAGTTAPRTTPPATSTAPAIPPPAVSTAPATTLPSTPQTDSTAPRGTISGNTLPPAPDATPVIPPVATIETPRSNTPVDTTPAPVAPAAQTTPPIQVTVPAPTPVVVAPPLETPSIPATITEQDINWNWPFRGAIVGRFGDAGVENKGLDLAGNEGDPIVAAAAGEVVYSGSGLLRYGDLIIIKHNEHFLSAYAHNSKLLVKEGEKVTSGQKIAELGSSGIDRNMLHFEIRLDGKPVDPQLYLPAL